MEPLDHIIRLAAEQEAIPPWLWAEIDALPGEFDRCTRREVLALIAARLSPRARAYLRARIALARQAYRADTAP